MGEVNHGRTGEGRAMKTINIVVFVFIFCSIFFLMGCMFHRPRYYPVRLSMKGETPCFSVANGRKERVNPPEISVVSIFHYASNEVMPVWYQTFFKGQSPMKLSPLECLVYGAEEEAVPALQHGVRYGVSIRAAINDYGVIYQSYFCLYKRPDGQTGIHHAKWNVGINGYDWRVCEQ